ncbi:MAG: hypothetical protein WC889_16800 [Myxococcota bacterium]
MKRFLAAAIFVALIASVPSAAQADMFRLGLSIGEGMAINGSSVSRIPVSLELVPSLGWTWFKFDLGLYITLEDLQAGNVALDKNLTLRPGCRFTPTFMPLYFRFAVPLQVVNNFDVGFLFGLGVDFKLLGPLGIFGEVNTQLTNNFSWGSNGVPLDFHAGLRVAF